ncbi:MAG TPA: hypothetical protein DEB39_13505 [Planctomycetaceae bacterium]|nr:hypothetical protein [Planctomycetaceae bacterium]
MYEKFFLFSKRPFLVNPTGETVYPERVAEESRRSIRRTLLRAEGVSLLVGAHGIGKSLLLSRLQSELHSELHDELHRVSRVVLLDGAHLRSARDFLRLVARGLGLSFGGKDEMELRLEIFEAFQAFIGSEKNRPVKNGAAKNGTIDAMPENLPDNLPENRCEQSGETDKRSDSFAVFALIDDAQNIPVDVFKEINGLSDHYENGLSVFRPVLAGTPALEELLTLPALEAFNQRIISRSYLEPFGRTGTSDYIDWRIAAVSTTGGHPIFSREAKNAIYRYTDGIPRLINQLCDATLLHAAERKRHSVEAEMVDIAWNKMQHYREVVDSGSGHPGDDGETGKSVPDRKEHVKEHVAVSLETDVYQDLYAEDSCLENGDDEELASFDIDCTLSWNDRQETADEPDAENSDRHVATGLKIAPNSVNDGFESDDANASDTVEDSVRDFESGRKSPGYVYDTSTPVVLQFPCYVDKNIKMMNWLAPGHRISSGTGTAYRAYSHKTRQRESWESNAYEQTPDRIPASPIPASPITTPSAHADRERHNIMVPFRENTVENMTVNTTTNTSANMTANTAENIMESSGDNRVRDMPPVAAGSSERSTATVSPKATLSPKVTVSPREQESASMPAIRDSNDIRTAIDEHFDETIPLPFQGRPIDEIYAASLSCFLPETAPFSGNGAVTGNESLVAGKGNACEPDVENAVRRVDTAAQRMEQIAERFDRISGEIAATLGNAETRFTQSADHVRTRGDASCRELFEEISTLHDVVAQELHALEERQARPKTPVVEVPPLHSLFHVEDKRHGTAYRFNAPPVPGNAPVQQGISRKTLYPKRVDMSEQPDQKTVMPEKNNARQSEERKTPLSISDASQSKNTLKNTTKTASRIANVEFRPQKR